VRSAAHPPAEGELYKPRHEPPRGRLMAARAHRQHMAGALDWGMGSVRCGGGGVEASVCSQGFLQLLRTRRPRRYVTVGTLRILTKCSLIAVTAAVVAAWVASGWCQFECKWRSGQAYLMHGGIWTTYALSPSPTWNRGLTWGRLAPEASGLRLSSAWVMSPPSPVAMFPVLDEDPSMNYSWACERPKPGASYYATVGKDLVFPILPLAVVSGLPAAWLAVGDLRISRRRRAGCCLSCGYDRRGLALDAECPECGTIPSR
jgi:hypothetical protein